MKILPYIIQFFLRNGIFQMRTILLIIVNDFDFEEGVTLYYLERSLSCKSWLI